MEACAASIERQGSTESPGMCRWAGEDEGEQRRDKREWLRHGESRTGC